MCMEKVVGFCIECRENVESHLMPVTVFMTIRDKKYDFQIEAAYCPKCKSELSVSGLMEKNAQSIDDQYRAREDIVTVKDIETLMQNYRLDERELAIILEVDEKKVTRWLRGQVPTKEDSILVRQAIDNPMVTSEKVKKVKF